MAHIDIVVGTVYGAAMLVAKTLVDELILHGHQCTLLADAQLKEIDPSRFLLLVTAPTGQGEIPPNLQLFASELAAKKPILAGLRYALIAMGDSSYPHFCGAGRTLDQWLQALGTAQVMPPLELDASLHDEPEQVALNWLQHWPFQP
ncbi:MAG: flavodoxin domain-containing protein [Aeromonas sp.]